MSENEQRAAIGQLLEDYAAAKKELAEKSQDCNRLAERLQGLHKALLINRDGSISDPRSANAILSELPDDFTPAKLRGFISDHSVLKGKVDALKSQLKPYGVE